MLDHFILYESAALSAGEFYFVRECSIKQLKSFFTASFSKQNMVTVNRQSLMYTLGTSPLSLLFQPRSHQQSHSSLFH